MVLVLYKAMRAPVLYRAMRFHALVLQAGLDDDALVGLQQLTELRVLNLGQALGLHPRGHWDLRPDGVAADTRPLAME